MEARMMLEKPEGIEATMKITMSIAEWTELRDQLTKFYPSWRLSNMITDLLTQTRKIVYEERKHDGY